jgi:hypothetical protein
VGYALLRFDHAIVHRVEYAWVFGCMILVPMPRGITGQTGPGGKGGTHGSSADKQCAPAHQILNVVLSLGVIAMVLGHERVIFPLVLVVTTEMMNLKAAVDRTYSAQALDPPCYVKKVLVTNQVTTHFLDMQIESISYTLQARPTAGSRSNRPATCRLLKSSVGTVAFQETIVVRGAN